MWILIFQENHQIYICKMENKDDFLIWDEMWNMDENKINKKNENNENNGKTITKDIVEDKKD